MADPIQNALFELRTFARDARTQLDRMERELSSIKKTLKNVDYQVNLIKSRQN